MPKQNFLRALFSSHLQSYVARRGMRRRGQALIEMALVVIVLLVLTLGLIQYGLIANAKVTMANLAREGARYAAVHGRETNSDDPSTPGDGSTTSIKDRVMEVASYTNLKDITDGDIEIETVPVNKPVDQRQPGDLIKVTIKYDMRTKFFMPGSTLIPGLNNFGDSTRVSATMVLE